MPTIVAYQDNIPSRCREHIGTRNLNAGGFFIYLHFVVCGAMPIGDANHRAPSLRQPRPGTTDIHHRFTSSGGVPFDDSPLNGFTISLSRFPTMSEPVFRVQGYGQTEDSR